MPGSLTVRQARLVLPDRVATGDLVVEDGVITYVGPSAPASAGAIVDGTGLVCLPGVIDGHVHFRDPGFPHKEDLSSGSRAAAAGGVTAFLDMPNTDPPTVTAERLDEKLALAAQKSLVHYGFFVGTNGDDLEAAARAAERAAGIKLFLGSSTGSLLCADPAALDRVFASLDGPFAVHAEDEARLNERKAAFANTRDPADHPKIRDEEVALRATKQSIDLATRHGRRLHVLHVSSAEEAKLLASVPRERITAETCAHYLFLTADDYARLGTRLQCNPPVREARHRDALWKALLAGVFDAVSTDHAPHTLDEKARPYPTSPSGLPGVEWLLPLFANEVANERVTWPQVARWLCEGPARAHRIVRKGRLEVGFDGDLVLVDPMLRRTIEDGAVHTQVGWSPYAGMSLFGWPVTTVVHGRVVYQDGQFIEGSRGRALTFAR